MTNRLGDLTRTVGLPVVKKAAGVVDAFARMERLDAHGRSLKIRL